VADFATAKLKELTGSKSVWTVGDRVHSSLSESGLVLSGEFDLPNSIAAITQLIGQIVQKIDERVPQPSDLYLFHNRPKSGNAYEPVMQRLLPLDAQWQRERAALPWPTPILPEIIGPIEPALIREYLFISLFQACAESLASENASRLAAMQRAEKNIADLLEDLNGSFHRLRQSSIDEELFDVITGFEALSGPPT
jgi:F-type H+-transporting ATPase subunit gamma